MNYDPRLCETCPWPLECCTEEGTPKPDPIVNDCPRCHEVWDFRMGEGRLEVLTSAPIATKELEDEVLV